jgi:hypothetical protein
MTTETRAVLRLGLVIIGVGGLLGAVVGAVFGTAREAAASLACFCCDPESEEPL